MKLPDTAILGQCSVFAVKASTKESFKGKAQMFLGHTMGSESLHRSFALMLHHDSDGITKSAIIGYPIKNEPLYCYDTLEPETAEKIVMGLNTGKGVERWLLEKSRAKSGERAKRRRLAIKGGSDSSSSDSDSAGS